MSDLHPLDLTNDDRPMSAEYRERVDGKIADGLKSLAEGKGSDGAAFFASLYAELDELERPARE